MNAEGTQTIRVKHRFTASAERVYDAWLDPARAGKWLFATDNGEMVKVSIDARVGGRFEFVDRRDGVDVAHVGEYRELDRPRRIVFTFAVPLYSEVYTTVFIDIMPLESGCELTLTHEGVLDSYAEGTNKGWKMIFESLENCLGS